MEIEIDREPLLPVQSLIGWDAASAGEETELLFSDREGGGGGGVRVWWVGCTAMTQTLTNHRAKIWEALNSEASVANKVLNPCL